MASYERGSRRRFPDLPAKPLAQVIVRRALESEREDGVYSPIVRRQNVEGRCESFCKHTVGVQWRSVQRWLNGEMEECHFDTADQILCNLRMLWFDVPGWENNETVRYAFTGEK